MATLRYQKLINFLIKHSFRNLKSINIKIKEKKMKYSMYAGRYYIFINPEIRKETNKYLIGCFAHELCHLEDYRKMNLLQYSIYCIKLALSSKYMTKIERRTDKRTIDKGYGKELLFQRKKDEKELGKQEFANKNKSYLSINEINELIGKRAK